MITYVNDIFVDTDEGRYVLIVAPDDGPLMRLDIHDHVLKFYAQVQREIRPYVLEAEDARRTMPEVRDEQADSGYELDDPKHPTFYERTVD